MPSFVNGKRSRLITIATAGTVATAAAISAVAFVLPSGFAASSAGADAHLMVDNRQQAAQGDTLSAARQQAQLYQLQYTLGEQQALHQLQVAQIAAEKAAAAKRAAAAKAAAAKAAAQRAAQQAAQQRAAQQRAAQQKQPTPSAPSGSPQQIAQQMLSQFGWSSSQFSCLQPLWEHESGWNVYASNPSTGAYGIPQAFPGSKMGSAGSDWQSNAATQIRWGLDYIKGLYGSPCGAWSHEQADGWY
jgi:hypothetical protein